MHGKCDLQSDFIISILKHSAKEKEAISYWWNSCFLNHAAFIKNPSGEVQNFPADNLDNFFVPLGPVFFKQIVNSYNINYSFHMNEFHSAKNILHSSEMIFIFPNIQGFWTTKLSLFGPNCIINSENLI